MKIAFFGDSLTEGLPGASYFDRLKDRLPAHKLYNYGKGGDTVVSLFSRLDRLLGDNRFDIGLVWVGVNDVFVHVSRTYPFLKMLRRQPWAKDIEDFKQSYLKLMDLFSGCSEHLIAVTPLFIGEDPASSWSRNLDDLADVIESLSAGKKNVQCINLRQIFLPLLDGKQVSGLPYRPVIEIIKSLIKREFSHPTQTSSEINPWHFTIDGVHLNANGADLVADVFYQVIQEIIRNGP